MTEPDVRDLLAELADSVDGPDLANSAWDRAVHSRRRRVVVAAGAAAVVLTVVAGAVYVNEREPSTQPAVPSPKYDHTFGPLPGPELNGFTVQAAPELSAESGLPAQASPLPASIDLSMPNPSAIDQPLTSVVAAFAIAKIVGDDTQFDGVMLIGPNGELRHLDAARLRLVANPRGDAFLPFTAGSLSPDGTRLAFAQPDGIAVFDIPSGQWTDFAVPDIEADALDLHWTADGASIRLGLTTVNADTGHATSDRIGSPLYATDLDVEYWWGPARANGAADARGAAYLDEKMPLEGVDPNPPAVVVAGGGFRSLLVIPDQQPRWKNCCAVSGWLDDRTIAYESTFSEEVGRASQITRVLAWDVLDGAVRLVTTVTGSSDMLFRGSYADLY
jgi:hypothetical protein